MSDTTPWGPTGRVVYDRTYSRVKPDGTKETWPETVDRVVRGNLALVYGSDTELWSPAVHNEAARLTHYMENFALLPAGRHLWATGVPGRQYLFNCHVAGWGQSVTDHFAFTALRLFEGGGVGTNYSAKHVTKYGQPQSHREVHIVCGPTHTDMPELENYLSSDISWDDDIPFRFNVQDSREGWAEAICDLIDQSWADGDEPLVYDVTDVRPSGSPLVSSGGTASGPAPFAKMMLDIADILSKRPFTGMSAMEIDHAIAECVVAGGNRRSARMAIMAWDDPQIFEFINSKQNTGKHWTTNISVEIDNQFLLDAQTEGTHAWEVLQDVTYAMLENGEPGFWNRELSQTGELGEIIATNPCGEIALEAWENCNLGHVNMDYFHDKGMDDLREAHRLMTRFLMRATYGDVNDRNQRSKLKRNRRIGVGHLGVQGFWAKKGVRFSDIPKRAGSAGLLDALYSTVRDEARSYAFELRIPEPVKVTTVAPTGSVAKLPGVSEGIHPIYARWFERRVRFSMRDEDQWNTVMQAQSAGFTVEDDIYDSSGMTKVVVYPTEDILLGQVRELGFPDSVVESAEEISTHDMLAVQRLYQEHWADNAVSFTVNIPEGSLSADALRDALRFFLPYLKGTTIMVDASRPQAPYTRITEAQYIDAAAKTVEDSTDLECSTGACPVK